MHRFWMGGACSGPFVPPVPVTPAGGSDDWRGIWTYKGKPVNDEDFIELLTLIVPLLCPCK
jgi:hypothetical protein